MTAATVARFGLAIGAGDTDSGTVVEVRDKYRGTVAYEVAGASAAHVTSAVELARHAAATPLEAHRRFTILSRAADLVEEREQEFLRALIAEGGKPHKASLGEVRRSVETLRWSAEEAKRINGETLPLDAAPSGVGRLALTVREPVGVVAAITPTNSPLNLVAHKVGPAIAAGNAVVLKPPQATPVCSLLLHRVLVDAGLPHGYFSVVVGPDLGDVLLNEPGIDFYNFTGSVAVGAHLRRTIGLRDALLELGGNSPVIVHHDADVRRAARACGTKGFLAAGQACTSVQRIYVHRDVADAFMADLLGTVGGLVVGDPRDPATDVGPMISEREAERVEAWVEEAVDAGATRVTTSRREGTLLWPTVLTDVHASARVSCEEVFGPVVVVEPYTVLDDAIQSANATPYGLHAAVFTASLDVAFTAIRGLEAGAVLVNEATQWRTEFVPFGGVKHSGSGREGPRYAVEAMTRLKLVMLALEPGASGPQ